MIRLTISFDRLSYRASTTLLTELVEVQLPSFDPSTGSGQAGVVGEPVEPQLPSFNNLAH
jgi:hypothetical protein